MMLASLDGRKIINRVVAALAGIMLLIPSARASVLFEASRIVFDAGNREQSFLLSNQHDYPVVIQAWVDDGTADGSAARVKNVPVITYPVVFKLGAKTSLPLRLINTGNGQSSNNIESLYWLNIQIVSPKPKSKQAVPDTQSLDVSMLMKFKLFYRPSTLSGPVAAFAKEVRFQRVADASALNIINPTPYHITFSRLTQAGRLLAQDFMLNPGQQQQIPLQVSLPLTGEAMEYSVIDDDGHTIQGKSNVSP